MLLLIVQNSYMNCHIFGHVVAIYNFVTPM